MRKFEQLRPNRKVSSHEHHDQTESGQYWFCIETALDISEAVDKALRYLVLSMFNAVHNVLESNELYSLKSEELEDWVVVTKWNF